jgi:pimeloyl-ACP methyl ester carboxylesterase
MNEAAVLFGPNRGLVGVVTDPPSDCRDPGRPAVLLLNAGLLHHVGPNRVYVQLARRLASLGCVVLRFDYAGVGDSEARRDTRPRDEVVVSETREAMDLLQQTRGADRFVLMGLCSGAVNAFNTALVDPRAIGAVLINPQGYDEELSSHAEARRYWRKVARVLLAPRRWVTAIPRNASSREMVRQLRRALSGPQAAGTVRGGFRSLVERGVRVLVLFSSTRDPGVDELETVLGGSLEELQASGRFTVETVGQAAHTFLSLRDQERLLGTIELWVQSPPADGGSPTPPGTEAAKTLHAGGLHLRMARHRGPAGGG